MNRSSNAARLVPPAASPVSLTCGGCGVTYSEAAWQLLPLSARLEGAEVRRVLSPWPDGLLIEVRQCSACGRTIAAKRHGK